MLTLRSLPVRTARYHWRANLPVLLGVAVGSAVLAGALLVGDSLRGSLRDRSLRQLNGVTAAYLGPRLIGGKPRLERTLGTLQALLLQGSASSEPTPGTEHRLGRVTVIGLDEEGFERFGLPPGGPTPAAVLGANVADHLRIGVGGAVALGVEKASAVARSSVLGRRGLDDVTATLDLPVGAVLPPGHRMNEFQLRPAPTAPFNVFVPLGRLQDRLGLSGKVNALLGMRPVGNIRIEGLSEDLAAGLTLADWGLRVRAAGPNKAYVSVESGSLVLDPPAVRAVEAAAAAIGVPARTTYSYLANAISLGDMPVWTSEPGNPNRVIGYSTVAALDPAAPPPLGPFLPPGVTELADDEIVLADWPESPFKTVQPPLKSGDPITLTYFKPEQEAGTEETFATFRFRGWVPFSGPAADPDLTPPFPGITDKLSIGDWESPFEISKGRVRPRDDSYWKQHRATPKAYITTAAGGRLWGSRFGRVTSVRVAPAPGTTVEQTADRLRSELPRHLDPAAAGFVFEPVRDRMLAASRGGTDFGGLFLAFSLFLIASALLLVGLLFRLGLDRRAKEIGLLLAAGYSPGRVARLLLLEGTAVAAAGALLGLGAAVGFAAGMLRVLAALWPDAGVGEFLTLHADWTSFAAGFGGAVLTAVGTIWLSLRRLVRVPPPALLRGETAVAAPSGPTRRPVGSLVAAVVGALAGGGLLAAGGGVSNPDLRAMTFFGGGGLLLLAGLLLARAWLRWPRTGSHAGRGLAALAGLGGRNATRNPGRSLLTAALIAAATFLLVAVESFRRRPDADFLSQTGGSGGYRLLVEADVPVFQPFDREPGRGDLLERLAAVYQRAEARGGPSRADRLRAAEAVLKGIRAVPFRLQPGDDASCLNLYQAGRPRVVGVPDELVRRGGFRFAQTEAATPEEKANPWLLLLKPWPDGAVPVFAEANSAEWMLKIGVGDTFEQPDGEGKPVRLRLVGTLQDSVFQSELLTGDAEFRRLYPRVEGFRLFIVGCPAGAEAEVAGLLETGLRANGAVVTPTPDRVAAYQKVVGTYLTTFQLLGGFGLLLGVLGLGAVILRAVWERAGELALLRAVGYRTRALEVMILAENLLVLSLGVGFGLLAAVASVLPNLAAGGSVPAGRVALLVAAVVGAGAAVGLLATARVARGPLIPALRHE